MHLRSSRRLVVDRGHVLVIAFLALSLGIAGCGGGGAGVVASPAATTTSAVPEEEAAEATDDSATLDILSDDPAEVLLNGKPIGKAPMTGYKVAPGSYDVTFVDERTGNRTMTVTVGPNESQTVKAPNRPTKYTEGP